jgi:hypothetical protein
METERQIMTQWSFEIQAEAEVEIVEETSEWVNYVATVSLGHNLGEPQRIRHTAYIVDGTLCPPEDAQDFDVVNEDLEKAYGVFAHTRLRKVVLAAMLYAARDEFAATREQEDEE